MNSSPACHELIKGFEGFRAHAYLDPAGIWTIGYGTTRGVKPGDVITESEASAKVAAECADISKALASAITVPITQNQFDACACFAYNLGSSAFRKSTLLRKINAGDFVGAAEEFLRWDKAGKPPMPLPGLTLRRRAEAALFRGLAA